MTVYVSEWDILMPTLAVKNIPRATDVQSHGDAKGGALADLIFVADALVQTRAVLIGVGVADTKGVEVDADAIVTFLARGESGLVDLGQTLEGALPWSSSL